MFKKTVHPLDVLLAVLASTVPRAAIRYWPALTRWQPVDFLMGLAGLLVAASTMLIVVGGMIAFAVWFFSPHRRRGGPFLPPRWSTVAPNSSTAKPHRPSVAEFRHSREVFVLLRTAIVAAFVCLTTVQVCAAERVQFESARYQVGPLQRRLALERNEPLFPAAPSIINGFLTKPEGAGPFPAIVHLHGCGGLPTDTKRGAPYFWSDRLASWGYAVLVVDSFTTRGIDNTCSGESAPRVADAHGALAWLARQTFVEASRIAVIGFSAGGIATLSIATARDFELFENESAQVFKAAVAYYPACGADVPMKMPTLILIGDRDDWTPAGGCRARAAGQVGGRAIKLIVYPEAYHSFDVPRPGRRYFGHWLEYNAAADEQATNEVRRFLAEQLR